MGTYRVTSGLWLLAAAVVVHRAPATMILVSAAVFAAGLAWMSRRIAAHPVRSIALERMSSSRRVVQSLYFVVAVAWLAAIAVPATS